VWRRAAITDRLFLFYFTALGLLIVVLRHRVAAWPVLVALHVFAVVVVLALVRHRERWPWLHAWYPLLMPLVTFHEVARLNFLIADAWQDSRILAFEAAIFPQPPTVWLGQFASPLVTEVLQAGYLSYYVMLPVVGGVLYARAEKTPFHDLMAATVLAYMICYAVFIAFPTEGPAHTLRHLHGEPLPGGVLHALVNFVQRAGVHGNAFPSAHVAGAVVALVFARRHAPALAWPLAVCVTLMGIAAVYDRYHYASDIVGGAVVAVIALAVVSTVAQWRATWPTTMRAG
jgi:membrane-associated phospholipid phosphatase